MLMLFFCLLLQETGSEFEPKITPSSHSSTLRRNNETKTQTLTKSTHQQQLLQPPIYDSIATKPTQSFSGSMSSATIGSNQAKTILSSSTNPFSTYDRNSTVEYRQFNSTHESNYPANYHTLATAQASNMQQKHLLDYRQQINGPKFTDDFDSDARIVTNSDLLNLSNSSIANQLLPNTSGGATMRLNSNTLITSNNSINKETNRNHHSNNRNHIITDTLPGPESCV